MPETPEAEARRVYEIANRAGIVGGSWHAVPWESLPDHVVDRIVKACIAAAKERK